MSKKIENQILQLRQNHEIAAGKMKEASKKYTDRLKNPRRINDIASKIVALPFLDRVVSADAIMKVGIGPTVHHRAEKAIEGYDLNIDAARKHYEQNTDTYHQMAADEASVPVNFSGERAMNVHKSAVAPTIPEASVSVVEK